MNDRLNVRQELQEEVTRLRAEARGMADTLQSETRMRLRTQDRLEAAQRALDEARIRYVLSANHRHLQTTLDCLNTLPPRADSGGRDRVVRP